MRIAIVVGVLFAVLGSSVARAADESDIKPDVKALEKRFKVVKQRYDADKRRYVFTLEATETSDKACHYDASFQDADDKEVKSVQVEFEDGGRDTTKGQKYTAVVKYPTRKTMEKVTQVVIKKGE